MKVKVTPVMLRVDFVRHPLQKANDCHLNAAEILFGWRKVKNSMTTDRARVFVAALEK